MNPQKMTPELRFPEFSGEWQVKKLGDVTHIYDGTHQTPTYVDRGVPFYSVEQVTADDFENTKFVSDEVYSAEKTKLEKGDILMTRIGDIGTAKYLDWDVRASYYVSLSLIKPSREIDGKYLEKYIATSEFQSELWRRTIHVAFPKKINLGEIGNCIIRVPQKPEQEKIAEFLTAVDARIAAGEQKLASLAQYKKAVMQQIFSQQIRFKKSDGSNYPDWQEKRIGEIGEVIGGGTPATSDKKNWDGSIYWLTPTEVKQKYITKSKKTITDVGLRSSSAKLLPKGTVIFTSRATVGDVAISEVELTTNQGFQSVVVNRQNSNEFIYYWITFNKTEFLRRANGSTFPEISGNEMKKMKIPIPASEEQQKIATFLAALDARIAAETTRLTSAKEWKKGLLQRMFV